MIRGNGVTPSQVGDGARDFQDPVVSSGAEVEVGHGVFEEFVSLVVETAMFLELGVAHARVAGDFLYPS